MHDLTLFSRNHITRNYNNRQNYNIDLDNHPFRHGGWRKFHCEMDYLRPRPDYANLTRDQSTALSLFDSKCFI